jgi:hypothetical protein
MFERNLCSNDVAKKRDRLFHDDYLFNSEPTIVGQLDRFLTFVQLYFVKSRFTLSFLKKYTEPVLPIAAGLFQITRWLTF